MAYTPKRGDIIWLNFSPQAASCDQRMRTQDSGADRSGVAVS